MILLLISLLAGVLTILAPCVLPLLPIIVGGSLSGRKKDTWRPYIIASALAVSVVAFTLTLKVSTVFINLSPSVLNWLSGGLLIALGLVSAVPELWEHLVAWLNWEAFALRFLGKSGQHKGRYAEPVLIGLALGPVFASCSPTYAFILASVLPFSLLAGSFYLIAYSAGLAIALLVVALAGRKITSHFSWAINTHSPFRRLLGVLFILIGVAIISGYQVKAETWVGNHLPFDESSLEQKLLVKQHKQTVTKSLSAGSNNSSVLNVQPTPAPELQGLTNWINSPPLTLAQLRGKVALVDFWTYSCINCIRSLPYLEKWDQAYRNKGLVIIGVNTPEFAFEHNPANVAAAVKSDKINYPVALDNNDDTWNAYSNDSWPADYLIDKTGQIRYVSLGEGDYNKTERAIQDLLGINQQLQTPTSVVPISSDQTPETYFGTNRAQNYVGSPDLVDGSINFAAANSLAQDQWTLSGGWQISSESITSNSNDSQLTFHLNSKDVYMVATGNDKTVKVSLPGGDTKNYSNDVMNGQVLVNSSRLYHIVSLKQLRSTIVNLVVPKGVSLYTFTFGS